MHLPMPNRSAAPLTNTKIMFFRSLSLLAILHVTTTTTTAINTNTSPLILPPPTTNLSIPFMRVCDGQTYGYNIPYGSCADALLRINASDTTEQTYGRNGRNDYDVIIPRRYISCT